QLRQPERVRNDLNFLKSIRCCGSQTRAPRWNWKLLRAYPAETAGFTFIDSMADGEWSFRNTNPSLCVSPHRRKITKSFSFSSVWTIVSLVEDALACSYRYEEIVVDWSGSPERKMVERLCNSWDRFHWLLR